MLPRELLWGYRMVMTIALTTGARLLELASSTENRTIGNGGNHVGKEKKGQKDEGLGIQIHHEKDPIQAQARNQKEVGGQGYALDVSRRQTPPTAAVK